MKIKISYLLCCISFLFVCSAIADNNEIKDDEVIAKAAGKNIIYKEIKLKNVTGLDKRNIRQIEVSRLRRRMLQIIIQNEIKNRKIIPSEEMIDKRIKTELEKMYGKTSFTNLDAQEQNKTLSEMVNLLEVWQNDNQKGEALYKDKFKHKLTEKNWNKYKKMYASQEQLEALKKRIPKVSVKAVYGAFRKLAVRQLEEELLTTSLKQSGEIEDNSNFHDWSSKKLRECVILKKDFIPSKTAVISSPRKTIRKSLIRIDNKEEKEAATEEAQEPSEER